MQKRLLIGILILMSGSAYAEPAKIVFKGPLGNSNAASAGASPVFSQQQALMLQAAKYSIERQFPQAEAAYTQVLNTDSGNIDAYLQRAIVRRELSNAAGQASDARAAIMLADRGLQTRPNEPHLLYQRGTGYRLNKQFDLAKRDVTQAIQLSGRHQWDQDLQAIELERLASL